MSKTRATASAAVLLAAMAACDAPPGSSTDAGVDASAADASQADASQADASRPIGTLDFMPCDDGLECATLTVPLDHADPDGRTVELAVTRRPASSPERRVGVLVMNFGGPGVGSGWAMRQSQVQLLIATQRTLRDRFDLVGLDWRGVGESRPLLSCDGIPFLERAAALYDTVPAADDAELTAIEDRVSSLIADCTEVSDLELLAHVDTTSAARDLELLRVALGEEQLNYLGLSYGTLLGAVYATLHPDRVRAFVLDSPVGPLPDGIERIRRFAVAREDSFTRWLEWCAAEPTCAFREGTDAATIGAAFLALIEARRVDPLVLPDGRAFTGYGTLTGAMNRLYAKSWVGLGIFLAALRDGDTAAIGSPGIVLPEELRVNAAIALNAIACTDFSVPAGFSHADFATFASALAAAYPLTGEVTAYDLLTCRYWPVRAAPPSIGAPSAPPLLVAATRHDPALDFGQAEELVAALDNGSRLLTFEGDGHGALVLSLDCVMAAEMAFLVDPATEPPTSCP